MSFLAWFNALPPLWLHVTIIALWLVAVGLFAEWLYRHNAASEIARKVVHIGVGNVILLAWWFEIPAWIGISASVFFSAIAFLSYKLPILPSINGVGRKSLGTFFYAVSIGVLIAVFWTIGKPHFAVLGILVMTWGDGLAALVGQRFGKHPYKLWGMHKSWEGSLTMAVVTFAVSSLILLIVFGNHGHIWLVATGVALIATALEAFSKFGIDNLTVPIGSAAICYGLTQLFMIS
jgi:phytol kinase